MFDVTLHKTADHDLFVRSRSIIESCNPSFHKTQYLIDVDGSEIMEYANGEGQSATVYNDYDVDAIYIKADIPLRLES